MDYDTLRKYYISRVNMLKVARYRGYKVSSTHELTYESFVELYEESSLEDMKAQMSNLVFGDFKSLESKEPKTTEKVGHTRSGGTDAMILVWHQEYKMGLGVRDVVNEMDNLAIKKAIIVVDIGITPGCREIISNIRKIKKFTIDIWTLEESMIFVPDHILVPKHRICSAVEKKKVLKRSGIKIKEAKHKIPCIKKDSVMVKYLGASKNQLVEITRQSETDPDNFILSYRIVV